MRIRNLLVVSLVSCARVGEETAEPDAGVASPDARPPLIDDAAIEVGALDAGAICPADVGVTDPDGGASRWRPTGGPWDHIRVAGFAQRGCTQFVATDSGVFRSDDAGETFRSYSQGLTRRDISGIRGIVLFGDRVCVTASSPLFCAPLTTGVFSSTSSDTSLKLGAIGASDDGTLIADDG